jgi:uncharacterized protein
MQTNLLWTGREYHSLENCIVDISDEGVQITSTIIGTYESKIYKVEYRVKTNSTWETLRLEINSRHSDKTQSVKLESDGKGNWKGNIGNINDLKGCIDVDIPLTPLTNTLPINRLNLRENNSKENRVVYLDLLEGRITPVTQQYTRLSKTKYHYQNVPNDFEAILEVDESGFVVDYPSLFVRTAALKSNYR